METDILYKTGWPSGVPMQNVILDQALESTWLPTMGNTSSLSVFLSLFGASGSQAWWRVHSQRNQLLFDHNNAREGFYDRVEKGSIILKKAFEV